MTPSGSSSTRQAHWWHRRGPSLLVFAAVLATFAVIGVVLAVRLTTVLPTVGEDLQGADPWTDPVGVELAGPFQVAHIPDCAMAPVAKIVLWDEDNQPLWEVSGPAQPLQSFAVGATPEGFKVDTPFTDPQPGSVLRLVVIRQSEGPAGIRYQVADLRAGRVVALRTLSRFTVDGFRTADVCSSAAGAPTDGSTSSTTLLGG